ncbi:hypothetical protein QBC42DRAFT_301911 [Cladorrhinum samala]|uniref:Uncharacterized protein n=1 Tax=Cladorrhinum samala TaxID=585594 RepID=A0AAV9H7Y6_9PEZI|nr:hypothetical protein QBC42DRAFT_301911 [Cladorrhinum samala]
MKFSLVLTTALSTAVASMATRFDISPGLEIRAGTGNKHHHAQCLKVDFRKACVCREDHCPTFLNEKALCECKAAHQEACYFQSERGCPKPSFKAC